MGTAAWALVLSIVAIVVAGAAAAYARVQARATQVANAADVAMRAGAFYVDGRGFPSLELTFRGHHVRHVKVTLIDGPADLIGEPGDTTPGSRSITLDHPVAGQAIAVPVHTRPKGGRRRRRDRHARRRIRQGATPSVDQRDGSADRHWATGEGPDRSASQLLVTFWSRQKSDVRLCARISTDRGNSKTSSDLD